MTIPTTSFAALKSKSVFFPPHDFRKRFFFPSIEDAARDRGVLVPLRVAVAVVASNDADGVIDGRLGKIFGMLNPGEGGFAGAGGLAATDTLLAVASVGVVSGDDERGIGACSSVGEGRDRGISGLSPGVGGPEAYPSSSSELSPSSELRPSSSYAGPVWCERTVPTPSVCEGCTRS